MKPAAQRRSIGTLVGAVVGLLLAITIGGCAPAAVPPAHAGDPPDRLLDWEKQYVRPCAKSGGRLIC